MCIAAAAVTLALLMGVSHQPSSALSPFGRPAAAPAPKGSTVPKVLPAEPLTPQQPATQQPTTQQNVPSQDGAGAQGQQQVSPDAAGAEQVVRDYLKRLVADRPYEAVDEFFDVSTFERRIFGDDFNRLPRSDSLYIHQLANVILKSLVSGDPIVLSLVGGEMPAMHTTVQGSEARVTFTAEIPTAKGRAQRHDVYDLRKNGSGWKIIDFGEISLKARALYKEHGSLESAAPALEGMAAGIISSKVRMAENDRPAEARVREAQEGNLRAQLQSLMNQLELYKARTGHYPDLLAHGWDDLIKGGYIKKAPVNPVNKSSEICEGPRGKAGFGWTWVPGTGDLGATYFDEKTAAVTPDSP
jgi:hypothetical protein